MRANRNARLWTISLRWQVAAALLAAHAAAFAEPLPQPRIMIDGLDRTKLAGPIERKGLRLVNLSAIGALAGFELVRSGEEVAIESEDGRRWNGVLGDSALVGDDGLRVLSGPLVERDGDLYGPADAVDEIRPGAMKLDYGGRESALLAATPPQPQPQVGPPPSPQPGGWEPLSIEKTADEKDEYERIYGPGKGQLSALKREIKLPATHESLSLLLSQGYVQGADWGTDTQGGGLVGGYRMDFWSQSTMGPKGFEMRAGRFSVASPESSWSAQAGDLVSDIWGWGRGGRFAWQGSDWHAPMVSYYQRTQRSGKARNVLTVTDYVRVRPWLAVGGEAATDGSFMFRPRLRTKRFSLMPYYRIVPNENRSRGVYGSLSAWSRASLFAGYTRSTEVGRDDREWLDFGLRVPLPRGVNLTLQRTRTNSLSNRNAVSALSVSLPAGKFRIFGRYQYRDAEAPSRAENFGFFGFRQHEFFGGATYTAGKRFSLGMQSASRWRRDGAIDQWQQITGLVRFSAKSWLETTSVLPDATTPSQHRARFTREVNADWALLLEYGNLSPYQSIELDLEDERFKILLRRRFNIPTPAVGGDVSGVVSDALGYALEGVLVRLGPYATITDTEGRYGFRHVPEGEYALSVDDRSLPADYTVTEPPQLVETSRRSFETSDWTVIPLNTVAGRVCLQRGPQGVCDAGSGVENVAVYLGGRVTATREGGLFLFHNVAPGRHRVTLGLETLPAGMEPVARTEAVVEVEAGKRTSLAIFTLREIHRQVIFQSLDEE